MKTIYLLLLTAAFTLLSCTSQNTEKQNIADVILQDTSSFFYIDAANYPVQDKSLPIGIFDSGTGGLTVFDAIIKYDKHNNADYAVTKEGDGMLDFQSESFTYLGDMANMPYGQYSSHNKTELLKEHIIKDVQFLLGNKYYSSPDASNFSTDKSPIKALVIACNTATAYGKYDIEKFLAKAGIDMKVIGVIGAGVRGALSNIEHNEDAAIGVLATFGTVCSNGYLNELLNTHAELNYTGKLRVFQQAGIGWAGAIDDAQECISQVANTPRDEYKGPSTNNKDALIDTLLLARYGFDWSENKMLYTGELGQPQNIQINSIDNYTSYHIVSLLEQIIKDNESPTLKSIILGCTHYPFYKEQIQQKLHELYNYKENDEYVYRHAMAESIDIIDPAENTSSELYEYLKTTDIFNDSDLSNSEFYISITNRDNPNNIIGNDGNFTYEYKYGRYENNIQEYVKRVPFSKSALGESAIDMLAIKAPLTYKLIKNFVNSGAKTAELPKSEKLN